MIQGMVQVNNNFTIGSKPFSRRGKIRALVVKCKVCLRVRINQVFRLLSKTISDNDPVSEQMVREFIAWQDRTHLERIIHNNRYVPRYSKEVIGSMQPQKRCYCLLHNQSIDELNNTKYIIKAIVGVNVTKFPISFIPKEDKRFNGHLNWSGVSELLGLTILKWIDKRPVNFMTLL